MRQTVPFALHLHSTAARPAKLFCPGPRPRIDRASARTRIRPAKPLRHSELCGPSSAGGPAGACVIRRAGRGWLTTISPADRQRRFLQTGAVLPHDSSPQYAQNEQQWPRPNHVVSTSPALALAAVLGAPGSLLLQPLLWCRSASWPTPRARLGGNGRNTSWYYENYRTLTKPPDRLEYLPSVGGWGWHPYRKLEDAQAFRPAPILPQVTHKATNRRHS